MPNGNAMKKILICFFLIAICTFFSCEQVNPMANSTTGSGVQVAEGNPMMEENEDNNND